MITYRMCEKKDREIWVEMNREFMAGEIQDDSLWNNTDQADDEQFHRTFSEALKAEELIDLMIFEENAKPAGFANLLTIFSVWAHGRALIIDDLYIRPQARGKGYGRQAMIYIEEYARKAGSQRLQFQSEISNPEAMDFYKAVGYTPADMKFYVKYLQAEK